MKTEPETYGWSDLEQKGEDKWDGVRNYQARNFMQEMQVGDQAFFYHSGKARAIVGVATISKSAYPDPTTADDRWVCVEVKPDYLLKQPVTLDQIKNEPQLSSMLLLRNSRLSVQPVTDEQFHQILKMSQNV